MRMRWYPEEGYPKHGEQRKRIVFAWFPVMCADGFIYWLEKVAVTEIFNNPFHPSYSAGYRPKWWIYSYDGRPKDFKDAT